MKKDRQWGVKKTGKGGKRQAVDYKKTGKTVQKRQAKIVCIRMEEGAKTKGKGVKKDRQGGRKKTGKWVQKRQARG